MRLGEDHLFARFTNLKTKQKQEEEMMQQMLMNSEITNVRAAPVKVQGLIKVSRTSLLKQMQAGMLDKKKIVVDARSSEEQQTGKKKMGSSMMQLVGDTNVQQAKKVPFIFGHRKA